MFFILFYFIFPLGFPCKTKVAGEREMRAESASRRLDAAV